MAVELAGKWPATVGEILGAAIAHEVGHLILGANAHSATGVMLAHWSKQQFRLIGTSALNFSRDQANLLQERIGRRALNEQRLPQEAKARSAALARV